jgi:3'-phosphoadenosine 5'-phosphosulfate (PAPS) 3'-phosphatase
MLKVKLISLRDDTWWNITIATWWIVMKHACHSSCFIMKYASFSSHIMTESLQNKTQVSPSLNVSSCTIIMMKHYETQWSTRRHHETSRNISKHHETSENIRKHQETSRNITKHHERSHTSHHTHTIAHQLGMTGITLVFWETTKFCILEVNLSTPKFG